MEYEDFFAEVEKNQIEVRFDNQEGDHPARLSNEALFHLPLLAITVLMLAKDRRKPKVDELGQVVGECFERSFSGFKGSSQHLGWSANLRVRTVRALTFLETTKLVNVTPEGQITATPLGRAVVRKALQHDSDLTYTLKLIERNYRNLSVEKQLSLVI